MARILVACEFSGIVRDAFIEAGHDAVSCDILPSERPGPHYQEEIETILSFNYPWALMIAFPPCTHLATSGARWFKDKQVEQEKAVQFVKMLMDADIPRICIENPVGVLSTKIRKPDQIVQPFMFGHGETKATCLWLKNLPKLTPTNIVEGRVNRVHFSPDSKDRWKRRSRTLENFAKSMVDQWGKLL
jgi:hypothetical protein